MRHIGGASKMAAPGPWAGESPTLAAWRPSVLRHSANIWRDFAMGWLSHAFVKAQCCGAFVAGLVAALVFDCSLGCRRGVRPRRGNWEGAKRSRSQLSSHKTATGSVAHVVRWCTGGASRGRVVSCAEARRGRALLVTLLTSLDSLCAPLREALPLASALSCASIDRRSAAPCRGARPRLLRRPTPQSLITPHLSLSPQIKI